MLLRAVLRRVMQTTTPLPAPELVQRLRQGSLTLAFDTNAVEGHAAFLTVCDAIALLNASRTVEARIRVVVYAVAHGEKLLHLRQQHSQRVAALGEFDDEQVFLQLSDRGIEIHAFEEHHARAVASLQHSRYPTRQDWWAQKRTRYIHALGVQAHEKTIAASGKRCSATVDWLLAAQAEVDGHILVTEDTGPEFDCLAQRTRFKDLEHALGALEVWPPPQARTLATPPSAP